MIVAYASYAVALLLVAAFVIEIRTGRIPNWLVLLLVAVFVVMFALADDRTALYWQIGMGAAMFIFGLVLFAVGGVGAGAVKLLAATALFIPPGAAIYTFLAFLVVFFVSSFIFVQIRKAFGSEDSQWHLMAKQVIPLSFSIAVAGILGMFVF